ncbi:hypothetical protein [Pimelobacter sp. 30-1]|uniref:hypothetical protein n=1 Tax=Pimelobacter sp. 30-1 TaxID=2004991 RepID=UPI001C03B202|nr:hypothetical protein [Pimelobacter sp. 30-1]MBU2694347.1 hypothetical protein [Pimelobacter sp. 30-1]
MDFFEEVLTCARSQNQAQRQKGRNLLQQMHEPNETCLGYSDGPPQGKGFGEGLGAELWDQIVLNRTLQTSTGSTTSIRTAVLSRLERVPLFVKKVDRDLISDLATRVTFNVLADFTGEMMDRYPSLAASASSELYPTWDSRTATMVDVPLNLPTFTSAGGEIKHLLLVPKDWIFWRLVMDPTAFYHRYATQTIQEEQTTWTSDGRANKPTKKSIEKQNKDKKVTNAQQANKYARDHDRDLAAEYEAYIDSSFSPLSDLEIDARLR